MPFLTQGGLQETIIDNAKPSADILFIVGHDIAEPASVHCDLCGYCILFGTIGRVARGMAYRCRKTNPGIGLKRGVAYDWVFGRDLSQIDEGKTA